MSSKPQWVQVDIARQPKHNTHRTAGCRCSLRSVILRDPVHGLIAFEGPTEAGIVRLIDTAEVQRLRRIKCLGPAALAFPGAEHSRFAHALGSAYVMKRYLQRVGKLANEIPEQDRIDTRAEQIALAAALLHDLGHGPFSHAFEAVIPGTFVHEEWTSELILDPQSQVHRVLREIDPSAPKRVERLVHGEGEIPHLARAVSGTFDVDRCDYLLRDSHMTGVRYGVLDLDWLLQSLRLHAEPGRPARLAVDGEKGLTAVEGFFLGRLYMYRQVYLHKAVRAAEAVMVALVRRLRELDAPEGTPPALLKLLRGDRPTLGEFLELDDIALEHAFARYSQSRDPVLADLASRLRTRRLFKSIRLRPDVPHDLAKARLDELMHGHGPSYLATIDRVEVQAYQEDEAIMVLTSGRSVRLREASPVLHGLSAETFVHYRAIFPETLREPARQALADLR